MHDLIHRIESSSKRRQVCLVAGAVICVGAGFLVSSWTLVAFGAGALVGPIWEAKILAYGPHGNS